MSLNVTLWFFAAGLVVATWLALTAAGVGLVLGVVWVVSHVTWLFPWTWPRRARGRIENAYKDAFRPKPGEKDTVLWKYRAESVARAAVNRWSAIMFLHVIASILAPFVLLFVIAPIGNLMGPVAAIYATFLIEIGVFVLFYGWLLLDVASQWISYEEAGRKARVIPVWPDSIPKPRAKPVSSPLRDVSIGALTGLAEVLWQALTVLASGAKSIFTG